MEEHQFSNNNLNNGTTNVSEIVWKFERIYKKKYHPQLQNQDIMSLWLLTCTVIYLTLYLSATLRYHT